LLSALPCHGEQKIVSGPHEIHYIAFVSSFVTPEIARSLGLVRATDRLVLNISVRRRKDEAQDRTVPGVARVSGRIINLLSQGRRLDFREVRESDAIYYLAQATFTDGEVLRFALEVLPEGAANPVVIDFKQKFHVQ